MQTTVSVVGNKDKKLELHDRKFVQQKRLGYHWSVISMLWYFKKIFKTLKLNNFAGLIFPNVTKTFWQKSKISNRSGGRSDFIVLTTIQISFSLILVQHGRYLRWESKVAFFKYRQYTIMMLKFIEWWK